MAHSRFRVEQVKEFYQYYLVGAYNRLNAYNLFLLSGGLAFSLFMCTVPLVLVLFSLLGEIIGRTAVRDQIAFLIERTIPYPDYAAYIQDKLLTRVEDFRLLGHAAGVIGLIGLLFAASGLFSSMRTVLNTVFTGSRRRFFLVMQLQNVGMVLLVLLFFLAATAIFPLISLTDRITANWEWLQQLRLTFLWEVGVPTLSLLIIFMLFYLLYRMVSLAHIGRKIAMVSAFWATFFWWIAKLGFNWYLHHWANFTEIYGVYVFLVVVASWVYYSAATFVIGAVIGQLYRERKTTT